MDDDDFSEERIQELVEHGRKNQRTATLITNWCRNARVERTSGRGLVEEIYNVPIGHMGVRCEHAPAGGLMCWDLEDAFLDHHEHNCKFCDKRLSENGPNIQPVIDEFEMKQAQYKAQTETREREAANELAIRRREREEVFDQTIPAAVEIRDLLDSIDTGTDKESGNRLIELARLAPDTFTLGIIDYLKTQALTREPRLGRMSADVLLTLPLKEATKVEVALAICDYGFSDLVCSCLEKNAANIPTSQIDKIIGPLAYRAAPIRSIGGSSFESNPKPLINLAKAHPDAIRSVLKSLLDKNNKNEVDTAARIISKITPTQPEITSQFQRAILAKLLRRKHLLPSFNKRESGDELNRLRQAATALFEAAPGSCGSIMFSLCNGGDVTANKEAAEIYSRTLKDRWNGPVLEETPARRLAFKRLLWMAVEVSTEISFHPSTNFFYHTRDKLVKVVVAEIDALFGAATMLSQTAKQTGKESPIETASTEWDLIEKSNVHAAVSRLQRALIQWAFMASKYEGLNGVKRIIVLYEKTPEQEVEFKANIVTHLTELIADTDTLNCVLPHLYSAMTHPEPLMRGSAATGIGNTPYSIQRDFPDLLFEVYITLMADPNIYVHQSAVRALKSYAFPEDLKSDLKSALINLIQAYYHETDRAEFLVKCVSVFVDAFLTETEIEGNTGKIIVGVIDSLPDQEACDAIERLTFSLRNAPGFGKAVAKRLNSEWGRELARSKLCRALFQVPATSLQSCVDEIYQAGKIAASINGYHASTFIALLSRAGAFKKAEKLCAEIIEELPDTREQSNLRAFVGSLHRISDFEASLPKTVRDLEHEQNVWNDHLESLKQAEKKEDGNGRFSPMLFR